MRRQSRWARGAAPGSSATGPRILFVRAYYSASPDAIVHAMSDLGSELEALGAHVEVLALAPADPGASKLPLAEHVLTPPSWARLGRGRQREQLWFGLASLGWIIRRSCQYDAVITVDTPVGLGYVGRLARRLSRHRFVHVSWVMDLFYVQATRLAGPSAAGWRNRLLAAVEVGSLRGRSPVVVLGECARSLLTVMGVTGVRFIPLAAPEPPPSAAPSADGPLRVLYAGHAGRRNPMMPILEAATTLRNEDIEFRVLASGDMDDGVRDALTRADHDHLLTFEPPLPWDDFRSVAMASHVHLVSLDPRLTGTSIPSKTYASMAMGRPVLYMGSRDGQAAADVETAAAGVVIDCDGAALVDQLRALLSDRSRLALMGDRGRRFVTTRRRGVDSARAWLDLVAR